MIATHLEIANMCLQPNVVLLGTCDTKLEELLYLRDVIARNNADVTFMTSEGSLHNMRPSRSGKNAYLKNSATTRMSMASLVERSSRRWLHVQQWP
jgi:uncharacterized protein (UPF0261 family)